MKGLFIHLLLLLLFGGMMQVQAQSGRGKLVAAELFFDTDPGTGNGTAFSLQGNANDAFRTALQTVSLSLPAGTHVLNVRYQDSIGNWGTPFKSILQVDQALGARNIGAVLGRAYWNGNLGTAVNLIILNGNAAQALNTFIESTPLSTFSSPGLHKLSVQVLGIDGQYSPEFSTIVKVDAALGVNRLISAALAEAYWDNTPAQSTGLIIVNGNASQAINEFATTSAINTFSTAGLHTLHVRLLDPNGNGNTSPVFTTVLKIDQSLSLERAIRVDAARVWFDNNTPPAPNMLAMDGNFNQAVEEALHSLPAPGIGVHKLNVQFRDSLPTQWGPVFSTAFTVEGPLSYRNINLAQGQLYWDNDTLLYPQALLAFDGSFSDAIESALQSSNPPFASGVHTLCVRFKEVANNWSAPFRIPIAFEDSLSARHLQLTQGEIQISDTSFMVIALNGNFSNVFESAQTTLLSSGIPTGLHKLKVRIKGQDNNWGPYFTSAILITSCASTPLPTITYSGSLNFCAGGQITLNAPSGYTSYTWMRGNTIVGNSQSYTATLSGSYVVIVTDNTNCPGASMPVQVNAGPLITIAGNSVMCQGTTDSLMVPTGYAQYVWSGGSTSYKQYITGPGTYTVTVTDNQGCSMTATKTISMLPQPVKPVISASGPLSFCPGQNVTLTSSITTNIAWNVGPTTPSITTDSSGYYTVTVTGANGCKNTSNPIITTKFGSGVAGITPSGPTTFCDGGSVTLHASSANSYNWSTGSSNSFITVSSSGTYSVALVDTNGCSLQASVLVTVNPNPPVPVISASGPLNFCNGSSVTLTSSAATNNSWSNGVTTASQTLYQSISLVDTVVNAFGCKSWSAPINVDVHPVASIAASGPTTFCAGDQVTLTASPASGVNYLWSTGATSSSITVNTSQSISVIVTEPGPGCKDTAYLPVTVHPLPVGTITASGSTTICSGTTITLQTSGSPNCVYLWYRDGSPITYPSYSPGCNCYVNVHVGGYSYAAGIQGTYTAKILDTLTGCFSFTNAISVTVIQPALPLITANGGTTLCIGANTVLTTTPAAAYLWSTGDTTQSIVASAQGTYTVQVTDNFGCTRSSDPTPVTFYQQALIVPSGATTFCAGNSVTLNAYPAGTYLWSTNSTAASIPNITSSGTYSLTVTDLNGCVTHASPLTITVNPLPSGSIAYNGPSSACSGNAVQITTQAVANAVYKWYYNGSPITYWGYSISCGCYVPSYHYGYTFAATASGNYSAEVIDTLTGCSSMTNVLSATIHPLPVPVITQTAGIACYGNQTASLLGSASGTVAPYTYSWSNSVTGATNTNLAAGTYVLTVTDANTCQQDTAYTVQQPALVSASAASPTNTRGYQISCYGYSDGSATANPSGGTPPYTYLWSTGATTASISNLSAGTYTVTVWDANNCAPATTTVTLTQPDPLSVSLQPLVRYGGNHISCSGENDGQISCLITGGTATMSFLWSNGQTTATANNLTAGVYSVQITDSVGCITTASTTLTEPAALVSTRTVSDFTGYGVSCYGESDGSISLNVSGGTMPYHISWADTNYQFVRNNLSAGNYVATITDTLGCTVLDTIVLSQPDTMTLVTTGDTLVCYGNTDGSISVSASGMYPPFQYQWAGYGTQTNQNNLPAGNYIVTVTDARGCTQVSSSDVIEPTPVQAYAFGTFIGCGTQIGLLSVTGTGGTPPYTQLWSNGSTASFQNNQPIGTYSVTLVDSHGCIDTATAIILSPPTLTATTTNYISSCDSINTVPAATVSVNASGGVPPYMYLWSNGETSQTISNLATGNYSVIVTDANGCTIQPVAQAYNNDAALIQGDTLICTGTQTTLSTVPGTSFTWSSSAGVVGTGASIQVGQGVYTLNMVNMAGCAHTGSFQVNEQVCYTILNLTCLLQGYYYNGQMQPVLLNQGADTSAQVTDTIVVELHEPLPPYGLIQSTTHLLQRDGSVQCVWPPFVDTAYLVIRHRNHVETWSAYPEILDASPLNYNFTLQANKAFGDNQAYLSNGSFALFTGDINQDGVVDGLDYNDWEADNSNFAYGYLSTDLSGDGIVDGLDFLLWETNNNAFVGMVTP